jgi:hypothetical protein
MYVYARIDAAAAPGWVLPSSAVLKQDDAMVCFLIEGGKAVRTEVQVGRGGGGVVEVRKRKRQDSSVWEEFTGKEAVAASAAGLSDGQAVEVDAAGK